MPNDKKKRVLFLCTGNSARSQMAEVLLRDMAGDKFDVYSAGTQPEPIDPRTINALVKRGVEAKDLTSKNVNVFKGQRFDYVITLCDKANNECRSFPNAKKQLAWDFFDPKLRVGGNSFDETLNELHNRLSMFLIVEDNAPIPSSSQSLTKSSTQLSHFEPLPFYKCLTDQIRLKTLMLTHYHGELCVCELMVALDELSQPKVSRNLAVLKKAKVITDRKHGQWVFYRINPDLPLWGKTVIAQTTENNIPLVKSELERLNQMKNRPDKVNFCK